MRDLTSTYIETLNKKFGKLKKAGKGPKEVSRLLEKDLYDLFEKKAVLGMDIYQYSQYPAAQQVLIPYLFSHFYNNSVKSILELESFFFPEFNSVNDFRKYFIDTGDGGFQIFDNPIQSFLFATYFQYYAHTFNTGKNDIKNLSEMIGEITLRYSLSYDFIYKYKNNFYGPSIINCARIMSKDKLNRFLVDESAYSWFMRTINGIENIRSLEFEDFSFIDGVKKNANTDITPSFMFPPSNSNFKPIITCDILKIGEMKSKLNVLSVYSLHVQMKVFMSKNPSFSKTTITLGNLNSSGISDY